MTRSPVQKIQAFIILISYLLSLSACEVQFEPEIAPSGLGTVEPEQPFEEIPKTEGEFQLPLEGQTALVPGISSKMAIEICSTVLTWGDELMGMCEAPGGEHYLFWVDPREVFVVDMNTLDNNQEGFQNAVTSRKNSLASMWRSAKPLLWEIPVLGVSSALIPLACGSVIFCIGDISAAIGSGGLMYQTGQNITEDFNEAITAEMRAKFYACLLHGGDNITCRLESGIEELPGGVDE